MFLYFSTFNLTATTSFHISSRFILFNGIVKQKQRADAIDDCQSEVESSKTVEEVEEEEEEEVKVKVKDSKPQKRKRGKSAEVDKGVKKKAGGFTKVCSLSPQLQLFIGESKLARTEVVRRLWRYIKENNLQDPKNKQNIICDKSLHTLFQVDIINMFQMNKALAAHIWPLKMEDEAPADSSQRDDKARQDQEEASPADSSQREKQSDEEQEEGSV